MAKINIKIEGVPYQVEDGLTILEENESDSPVYVFNDYTKTKNYFGGDGAGADAPYLPIPPRSVRIRNIATERPIELCEKPALMPETAFDVE